MDKKYVIANAMAILALITLVTTCIELEIKDEKSDISPQCNIGTGRTVWKSDHQKGEPFSFDAERGGVKLTRDVKLGEPVMANMFESFGDQPKLLSGMEIPRFLLPYMRWQCDL